MTFIEIIRIAFINWYEIGREKKRHEIHISKVKKNYLIAECDRFKLLKCMKRLIICFLLSPSTCISIDIDIHVKCKLNACTYVQFYFKFFFFVHFIEFAKQNDIDIFFVCLCCSFEQKRNVKEKFVQYFFHCSVMIDLSSTKVRYFRWFFSLFSFV